MFEKPAGKEEKDRSRSIMIVSGAAVLAVIVLIVVVTQFVKPSAPVQMDRVHPVYDPETQEMGILLCPPQNVPQTEAQAYVPNIAFANIDKATGQYPNLNTRYARIRGSVNNNGDRIIIGLQLRMALFGHNCEVRGEKIITLIPERRSELRPGESISVDVSIDKAPDQFELKTMRLEPYGLKLK